MKIFKYEVPIEQHSTIELPCHCRILSFQNQNEKLYLWVLIDEDKRLKQRYFTLIGTGHEFDYHPDIMKYIGSTQMAEGSLVWHLFEDLIE